MDGRYSVLLSGVGGQGIVLMSRILGTACAASGIPVVTGEQHGLSQRSGSVSIHFRMGPGPVSPLIPAGTGDAIVGLEALESLRYAEYLAPGGTVITSTLVQRPVTQTAAKLKDGSVMYTTWQEMVEKLRTLAGRVVAIDAGLLARQAGNPQADNMVMLGALSAVPRFPVPVDALEAAAAELLPAASTQNLAAFRAGRALAQDILGRAAEAKG